MINILFQTSYAILTFLKREKLLILEWKGSCTENEYNTVFNEAYKIGDSNNVRFFLSDLRKEGPVTYTNLLWLKNEIIPKALEFGMQKIGLIFEDKIFITIYADAIRENLSESKIPVKFFSNQKEAKAWFNLTNE